MKLPIRVLKFILIHFSFFLETESFGQNQRLDSLKALMPSTSGPERIDLIFEIARAYDPSDIDKLVTYGNLAFNLALKSGDSVRIVKCGRLKAQGYRHFGKMDSAIFLFNKVLGVARRHNQVGELKNILNAMGTAHLYKAQYDEALKSYFEALKICELDDDRFRTGNILNNIGLVYLELHDYRSAMTYLKKSFTIKEALTARFDLEGTATNLALCFVSHHQLSDAQNYIDKAKSICNENCSAKNLQFIYNVQGIIFFEQDELDKAKEEFLASLALNSQDKVHKLVYSNLRFLLSISLKQNRVSSAEEYLTQIEKLIGEGTSYSFDVIQVYPNLIDFHLSTGNYKKAALLQRKFIALSDSIFSRKLTVNLMRIQAEHLEKENIDKINSQTKILSLNEQITNRENPTPTKETFKTSKFSTFYKFHVQV